MLRRTATVTIAAIIALAAAATLSIAEGQTTGAQPGGSEIPSALPAPSDSSEPAQSPGSYATAETSEHQEKSADSPGENASLTRLQGELSDVQEQVVNAEAELGKSPAGMIGGLIRMRLEALRTTAAMLDQRILAMETGAKFAYVLKAAPADEDQANKILLELARAVEEAKKAEQEAGSVTGGLAGTLAQVTLATKRQSVALLQLAYYSAQYGFPPLTEVEATKSGDQSAKQPAHLPEPGSQGAKMATVKEKPSWADTDHPGIDYDESGYRIFDKLGYNFRGRWALQRDKSKSVFEKDSQDSRNVILGVSDPTWRADTDAETEATAAASV